MAPNLTIVQMHLQCIHNVEIWEFVCDGCKSIRKFKICNHIHTQYKSEAQT
jgi:rRNA maturation endonuclease Nob1